MLNQFLHRRIKKSLKYELCKRLCGPIMIWQSGWLFGRTTSDAVFAVGSPFRLSATFQNEVVTRPPAWPTISFRALLSPRASRCDRTRSVESSDTDYPLASGVGDDYCLFFITEISRKWNGGGANRLCASSKHTTTPLHFQKTYFFSIRKSSITLCGVNEISKICYLKIS